MSTQPSRERQLPKLSQGSLKELPLSQLLYLLHLMEFSGELVLQNKAQNNAFILYEGQLCAENNQHTNAQSLASAFAWNQATYTLNPTDSKSKAAISNATLVPLWPVIQRGIENHIDTNALFQNLAAQMTLFPVVTQYWEERKGALKYPLLDELISYCDGVSSLEHILAKFSARTMAAFQATWFALETDLLVFSDHQQPSGLITLRYNYPANNNPPTATVTSNNPSKTDPGEQDILQKLREQLEQFSRQSAHESLGLNPGCGTDAVQKTYYALVKKAHPDAYNSYQNDTIRELAQEIFIAIKNAYMEAIKLEKNPPASQTAEPVQPTQPPKTSSKPSPAPQKATSPAKTVATQPPQKKQQNRQSIQASLREKARTKTLFNKGFERFRANNFSGAFELFEKAYQQESDNILYMTFYAYTAFLTDPEQADKYEKMLLDAIEQPNSPALPDAHLFLGHIYKAQKKERRALKHYKISLEHNPKNVDAQREIRLYEMRHSGQSPHTEKNPKSIFKKLFKK